MPNEPLYITDNDRRVENPEIVKKMQQFEQERLRQAEQREAELLNKCGLMDYIIVGIAALCARRRQKHR